MEIHSFEGKTKEEVLSTALEALNAKEDEVYIKYEEVISGGLFKKTKILGKAILKAEVIQYTKNFLLNITKQMGLTVNIETKKRDNYNRFTMFSENNSILIGKEGRTIDALQKIVRQAIVNQTGFHASIIVDVESYKEKRQSNIEYLARKTALEVAKTKQEAKMTEMNSFERRLIHNVVGKVKGVVSVSEGEEPNRYVVIKPEK